MARRVALRKNGKLAGASLTYIHHQNDSGGRFSYILSVYKFGVPLPSMQFEQHGVGGEHPEEKYEAAQLAAGLRKGMDVPYWLRFRPTFNRLPVTPIWSGFFVNACCFAALTWMLIAGPMALRRMIRRRRGLCPQCAYDLRGTGHAACPECGTEVAKA